MQNGGPAASYLTSSLLNRDWKGSPTGPLCSSGHCPSKPCGETGGSPALTGSRGEGASPWCAWGPSGCRFAEPGEAAPEEAARGLGRRETISQGRLAVYRHPRYFIHSSI